VDSGSAGGAIMSTLPNPEHFRDHALELKKLETFKGDVPETVDQDQLKKEFARFDNISFRKHEGELLALSPKWLYEQADKTDLDLFLTLCRYDQRNNTAVIGCFDNEQDGLGFELISYKRRRFNGGKWITRKDTHPNGTPFYRIFSDREPVVIVEGHHDLLSATLCGFDFVMLPTASYRGGLDSDLFTGRDIIFVVEDQAAYKTMRRIAETLEPTAGTITLRQLKQGSKMDLSDLLFTCNTIEEARGVLCQ
jgi:hypothetical protein